MHRQCKLNLDLNLCLINNCQALNLPFNVLSAADPKEKCRTFVDENLHTQKPTHWFKDMQGQMSNSACRRHPYTSTCQACPVLADIGILGSPCHPFSTQRSHRFVEGAVEAHAEFDVAMKFFMSWIKEYEPCVQIFEQVMGFKLPFHRGASETPLSRLPGYDPFSTQILNAQVLNLDCEYVTLSPLV